jgi:hypothetical protein
MQISLSLPTISEDRILKAALAYIILFFFLFNSIGYILFFELDRCLVKMEMQDTIRKNRRELTILKIIDPGNDREFKRIGKHEFEYKGKFYDIVREIKNGQSTVMICLHDTREETLVAGFNKVTHNRLHLVWLDHQITIGLPEPLTEILPSFSEQIKFPVITITLKSSLLPTWSPPPEYS